jgi:uncharacterized damage-inducible protein DinB
LRAETAADGNDLHLPDHKSPGNGGGPFSIERGAPFRDRLGRATMEERMSNKQRFLETFDHEHEITMRLLKAYPADQLDLRPHPKLKTAKELAFVFVLECGLGTKVWHDEFAKGVVSPGDTPKPPDDWKALLAALEQAHKGFRELVDKTSDNDLVAYVHFFKGPKTMGEISRMDWAWFLLHDQIHHRGQFSIYVRLAGGKVPSIYGPTADEPWM